MTEATQPSSPSPAAPRSGFRWRLLNVIGIVRAPERRLRVRLRWRFILFFGPLFFMLLGLSVAVPYSTSPSFCRSCHIMEPYYQGWAHSKHNKVACVDCHYPPGDRMDLLWKKFQALSQVVKFVTRTYSSKPYAEVEDASCLRSGCHSTRLLQGQVVSAKGIRFDHRPHLEGVRYGRQLRCVSCHSQVVVGKHIEVTWDTCYLCHMKGRKHGHNVETLGGCLGCHELPSREIKVGNITYNHRKFMKESKLACEMCHQDAIQGEGEVEEDRCRGCHNQPEKLARFKDSPFIHANHVTKHNTACFHCHREMRHGVTKAGTKVLAYDCGTCHSDMHDLQRSFYMGVGARGAESMPSPMYLSNVDCAGCHKAAKISDNGVSRSRTEIGTEAGCVECHGQEYRGILREVHEALRSTAQALAGKMEAFKKSLPAGWEKNPDYSEVIKDLDDAGYNLKYVGEAHAIHNIYYGTAILRSVDARLTALARETKASVDDLSALPLISGAFCGTMCHSRVGVQVPPVRVTWRGRDMPHQRHADEMACTTCHVFGRHKEVRLKTPTKCKKCHEEEKD